MRRSIGQLALGLLLIASSLVGFSTPGASAAEPPPSPGVSDSIVRLYFAVFDRAPDPGGREYWVDLYYLGLPLPTVATYFMSSQEWSTTYGEVSNDRFVELLYANVLDREPDAGGREYWIGQLNSGLDRTSVLLSFSESPEFISFTGTAQPEKPPVRFPAVPAHTNTGRRIVYSNSLQRVWLIEKDESVSDSYLVSGRVNTPRPGTYHVYSKSPVAWAGHGGITMQNMVRFRPPQAGRLAIGFHSIPRYRDGRPMQTEEQLGTFRSAGCVRQADHKAEALYAWADVGTQVVVLP